jgi:hypothetical protein
MSALPPKADIAERDQDVCFVPKADMGDGAAAPKSWSIHCKQRERRQFDSTIPALASRR